MKEGWKIRKLGEVCNLIADGDWIESKDQSDSGIRLIQTGNVGNGVYKDKENRPHFISENTFIKLKCTEIFEGDCLVSRLPDPVGRACLLPNINCRMITAVDCSILRFNNLCNPKWFVYYSQCDQYKKEIINNSTGSTRQRISRKNLEKIPIPIPPLSEQQRIVSKLDSAFEKIDALKAKAENNLKNAKDLFQQVLKKELEPKEGWKTKKICDVATKNCNIKWKDCKENKLYIDLSSVDRNTHLITEYQIVNNGNAPSRAQRIIKTNDILFATTRPTLKRFCIIPMKYDNQVCSTGFCVIRANPNIVVPQWIFMTLAEDRFYSYIEPLQKGASYPAVVDDDVFNYSIPIPSLSEQQRIVSILDSLSEKCKRLEENYSKTAAECDALKQAVLREVINVE